MNDSAPLDPPILPAAAGWPSWPAREPTSFRRCWPTAALCQAIQWCAGRRAAWSWCAAAAGGGGAAFNLGEMTVTRCTVRTETGFVGHAYVAGREGTPRRTRRAGRRA